MALCEAPCWLGSVLPGYSALHWSKKCCLDVLAECGWLACVSKESVLEQEPLEEELCEGEEELELDWLCPVWELVDDVCGWVAWTGADVLIK
jgi:hypothetical protein